MIVDRYQVQEWLTSHAPALQCPICSGRSFDVEENSLAMTNSLHDKGGPIDYLGGFPLVVLFCQTCAHVIFFSAKQMGVL